MKNITNMKELSSLIDKYFIPQELEKKTNAEVSTPHKLRQEMLDKIPLEFWTEPRLVFEPCAGKGGFLIDIIDRFMIGDTGMGVGKLLTCGGLGIWTIIDWFLIMGATREKNMETFQNAFY